MVIGVLALQGDFEAHAAMMRGLGVEVRPVRRVADLAGIDGIVIPGGESTTLLNLMNDEPWFPALQRFHAGGGAVMGTCAGAILVAKRVTSPAQPSLGLLDATVARNAFGRQIDSFEADLPITGLDEPLHAVFIRAPLVERVGASVEVLATVDGRPVCCRQGAVMVSSFHPELSDDARLHELFVRRVADVRT